MYAQNVLGKSPTLESLDFLYCIVKVLPQPESDQGWVAAAFVGRVHSWVRGGSARLWAAGPSGVEGDGNICTRASRGYTGPAILPIYAFKVITQLLIIVGLNFNLVWTYKA